MYAELWVMILALSKEKTVIIDGPGNCTDNKLVYFDRDFYNVWISISNMGNDVEGHHVVEACFDQDYKNVIASVAQHILKA